MNSLIKVLARSRLLKGDLDLHLVRGSMALIFTRRMRLCPHPFACSS